MKPDRLLNHLVVTALTIFMILLISMGAVLFRQISLQQAVSETNEVLQLTIVDLEETTQDLQVELLEIQTSTNDSSNDLDQWENVDNLLDTVDEQLDTIEQGIDDIELALEPQTDTAPQQSFDESNNTLSITDQADQLFTTLAMLVAIASIMIAVFLGIAIRVQNDKSAQLF